MRIKQLVLLHRTTTATAATTTTSAGATETAYNFINSGKENEKLRHHCAEEQQLRKSDKTILSQQIRVLNYLRVRWNGTLLRRFIFIATLIEIHTPNNSAIK